MRVIYKILLINSIIFCISFSAQAQLKMQKTRILLIMDASQSMTKPWESRSKIDASRLALSKFIDKCSTYGEIEFALRVFGNDFAANLNNCKDSKLVLPFAINNNSKVMMLLNKLNPYGTSPIDYSLKAAPADFPQEDYHKRVILLFTDGADACNQNICETYSKLNSSGVYSGIFIIGINLSEDEQKQFTCIENFHNVVSESGLKNELDKIFAQIKPY